MNIAYTMMPGRGDMDRVLWSLANQLIESGVRVCGVVQSNQERPGDHPCDMDVQVLPNGPSMRISQALGKESRGCRLDPGVLETAAVEVERRLAFGADLLLINKFGKHEAQGRGFTGAIVRAVEMDMPILCGLNDLNTDAFMAFTDGLAMQVEPTPAALKSWYESSVMPRASQSAASG